MKKTAITLQELESLAPRQLFYDVFQATFTAIPGAGYRLFLFRAGVDYEVVSEIDGRVVYFSDIDAAIVRLVKIGNVCHRITVDIIGYMSRSKYEGEVSIGQGVLDPAAV